jgi:hypothetical protein
MNEFEINDYVKTVKSLHPKINKGDIGKIDQINVNPVYLRVTWLTGNSVHKHSIVSKNDVQKITEDDYIADIL